MKDSYFQILCNGLLLGLGNTTLILDGPKYSGSHIFSLWGDSPRVLFLSLTYVLLADIPYLCSHQWHTLYFLMSSSSLLRVNGIRMAVTAWCGYPVCTLYTRGCAYNIPDSLCPLPSQPRYTGNNSVSCWEITFHNFITVKPRSL